MKLQMNLNCKKTAHLRAICECKSLYEKEIDLSVSILIFIISRFNLDISFVPVSQNVSISPFVIKNLINEKDFK